MDDEKNLGRSSGSNWVRILLVLSLGVNLLVAGAFLGAHLSGRKAPNDRAAEASLPAGPYTRALSRENRTALRERFENRRDRFNQHRKNMRASAQELATALRAEPFEIEAVREILMRQREVQIRLQDEGQLLFLQQIENMDAQARVEFADNLEKGLKRRKPRD